MCAERVRKAIEDFFSDNTKAFRGVQVDPLARCHNELTWTMTGNTPVARKYDGLPEFRAIIGSALAQQFSGGPEFGIYPVEIVVEGNRAAVMVKSHGESARGTPYNNNYFFFIEIKDGKLLNVLESCDGSLVMQSIFGTHIEEAAETRE
jgi:ketosteroid isomerase-like protein